jgi:hypothetical protein
MAPVGAFALPGRPEQVAVHSAFQRSRAAKVKKIAVKVETSQEEPFKTHGDAEGAGGETKKDDEQEQQHEFAFLPEAMGKPKPTSWGASEQKATSTSARPAAAHGHGQTADLDEASVILHGITTSEEAINFFARFGSETGVKFVHLQRVEDPKEFRPYDLERVDLEDHTVEHYTMSPAGIVHVCPGEASECIPLNAWMRQGMMFKILRNIPFYKYYLHRKAFMAWRENVSYQLFAKQRKQVADRLYMARNTTAAAVLEIKQHLIGIKSVKLISISSQTLECSHFISSQEAQLHSASLKF